MSNGVVVTTDSYDPDLSDNSDWTYRIVNNVVALNIDKQGTLAHALYDVKPKGHAEAVLSLIEKLS